MIRQWSIFKRTYIKPLSARNKYKSSDIYIEKYREALSGSGNILRGMPEKREVQRMEEQQKPVKAHKLVVNNRKTSMVTGVLDVLSFDLNEILLETEQGMLLVKGTDLHVNRLSVEKGEVDLSGTIDSVSYSNISQAKKQEESFWTKMFK